MNKSNKNWEKEKYKNGAKSICIVLISILLIIFWLKSQINHLEKGKHCINVEYVKGKTVNGKITKLEKNNKNHQTEIAHLNNETKFVWHDDVWETSGFFNQLAIGDSINKKENSFILEIHKKDTIIEFDMLKSCKSNE